MMNNRQLLRSRSDRMIAGVCGGLAAYFGISSALLRVIWAILIFAFGTGLLAYIIAAIFIPKE